MALDIVEFGTGVGYYKGASRGWGGSGKTTTAVIIGNGLKHHLKLPGKIAMFDTEAGGEYVNFLSKNGDPKLGVKGTGENIVGCKSRTLGELLEFIAWCVANGMAYLIVDSVSHVWTEVQRSMLEQINKSREGQRKSPIAKLEFQHMDALKTKWATFTDAFLNSKLHMHICGRAANVWKFEENEDGKKELIKDGTKMKAEGEMEYEPALLFDMERVTEAGRMIHRCTVLKDKFGVMNGMQQDDPGFDFFMPHVLRLTPGAVNVVNVDRQTDMKIIDDNGEWTHERRQRQIAYENFAGILTREWPGQSAAEKLARQEVCFKVLETRSPTEVENTSSAKLKAAMECLPHAIAEYKAEAAKKEAAESKAEADAKATKKKGVA